MYFYIVPTKDDAQHHGVLGMKWGVRRYQNKDGSLTSRGKRRLGIGSSWNGVTYKEQYKAKNTNNSGTTLRTDPFSEENNLKIVNGMLKDTDNCTLCTFAFDLRNRGIDVRAGGSRTSRDGQSHGEIESWYEGNRKYTYSSKFKSEFDGRGYYKNPNGVEERLNKSDKELKSQMIAQGEGTSGHLSIKYTLDPSISKKVDHPDQSFGHDVFYKVENGDVYIYDSQVGKKYAYDDYIKRTPSFNYNGGKEPYNVHTSAFLRTDDIKPRTDVIVTGSNRGASWSYDQISEKYVGPAAVKINTPKYNYSPTTISEKIETKPMDYNPPYKSKSELELILEDVSGVYNKLKNKLSGVVSSISKGLNKFKNTISKYSNVLYWKIF